MTPDPSLWLYPRSEGSPVVPACAVEPPGTVILVGYGSLFVEAFVSVQVDHGGNEVPSAWDPNLPQLIGLVRWRAASGRMFWPGELPRGFFREAVLAATAERASVEAVARVTP